MERRNEMNNEYFDLVKEYEELVGYRFLKQLNQFSLSFYIFQENYHELIRFLDSTIQKTHNLTGEKAQHEKAMFEITRLLHNFVASVQTLVDNTRVYYRNEFEENKLFSDYNDELKKRFAENELQLFVKDLRQHFQHYKIPLISFSVSLSDKDGSTARYYFSQKALADFKWKPRAKHYIEEQNKSEVDIKKFASDYYGLTKSFYDWFIKRQIEIRGKEIEKVKEYEGKLLSLEIEEEICRFINPEILDYNPEILIKLMIQVFPKAEQEKIKHLSLKQQVDLFLKSLVEWNRVNTSIAKVLQRKYYDYIKNHP